MQEVKWNEMKKVEGGSEDGDSILWGIVYVIGRIYCELKKEETEPFLTHKYRR